jgi:uncharacterized membrane protein YciS (DUF1049 family)
MNGVTFRTVTDEIQTPNPTEPEPKSVARGFLKPKPTSPTAEKADAVIVYGDQRKEAMRSLEPFERKLGYAASALALVFGGFYCYIGLTAAHPALAKPVGGKCSLDYKLEHAKSAGKAIAFCSLQRGHSYYAILAVIMAIFVIAIALSARIGRRVALAFTVLLTGFALSAAAGLAVAVPFILMGGWLMLRAWRLQKFGTTDARTVAKLNAQARLDRKNGVKTNFAAPSKGQKVSGTNPASPTAAASTTDSKRYTPKKPAPKRPAPPPAAKPQGKISQWLRGSDESGS